jgi:hypothetical protein
MAFYKCINEKCLFEAEIVSDKELGVIRCPLCNVMLMCEPDLVPTHNKPVGRLEQLEERIRELEEDSLHFSWMLRNIVKTLKIDLTAIFC